MQNKIQDIVQFATDCKTDAMRWNMPDELQDEYPFVMGDSDRVDAVVHEVGRENAS